jgi:acetyl esterase
MNQLSKEIEPKTRAFLEKINSAGGPQIYELSPEDARNVLREVQAVNVKKPPVDIEDLNIPGGPNGQISIRIFRPKGNKEKLPVVMYFHGAGWVLGDKDVFDRLAREITVGSNAAVVFINYSLSPEAKYPVAIEEDYAATKYIAENGTDHNLDPSRLAVAGDSVGGNMVAAVTLLAKERGGPKIDFQLLFYPVTDANFDNKTYKKYPTGHWLTREAMKWFWDNYLPDKESRKQPTASPLQAPIDQLKGLPPALFINGEFDVLREEGTAYAHKLIEAGVNVTGVRYLGTIHDFVMLNPIADAPAARSAIALATQKLQKVLSK